MTELLPRTATYDHALHGRGKPWRGILAIVSFVAGFLLISLVLGLVAIVVEVARGEYAMDELVSGQLRITPLIMLFNNLTIALSLPLAILVQRLFFGVRFGDLFSVTGRFRWGWFGRLALVIVPVWAMYIGVSFLLEPVGEITVDSTVIALLIIVVLTTPFQAAGEEAGARGLIQRSAGSWFRSPVVAFVVSTVIASVLFSLAHFAADPWLIAYYFVFGASASIAARGTGGLEAPILVHAVNNVFIFIPTVLLGQLDQSFERGVGAGDAFLLIPMAVCVAAALFSTWWARRRWLQTTQVVEPRMPRAELLAGEPGLPVPPAPPAPEA